MNELRRYVVCYCLAFAVTGTPAPLQAQESLGTRFLAEGPKGWNALRTTVSRLEGKCVARYKLGVHPLVIEEARFKLNGEHLVFEETRKNEKGKIDRVIALGANSKYRFTLQQRRPPSLWALADHGLVSDPMRFDHPYSRASGVGFVRFLCTPFTVNCMPISQMISEPGFKMGKVEEVTRDGTKLAKIEFTYNPPKVVQELVNGKPIRREIHMTKLRGGWMLLDPNENWSLRESSLDLQGGEKNTCTVEYAEFEGGTLMPSRVVEKDNAVSAWEVTFTGLRVRDIPEEEFTLTAYGLPEPMGVVWPKPTRWYLWITLAAVATLALGFGFYNLRRRFLYSQPAASGN